MKKLNIPTIGTEFVLASDWEFTLYSEHRNDKFWKNYQKIDSSIQNPTKESTWYGDRTNLNAAITLPAGTVISIARIYVRAGKEEYDSITFSIKSCPTKGIKGRFWVKLEDANEMTYVT